MLVMVTTSAHAIPRLESCWPVASGWLGDHGLFAAHNRIGWGSTSTGRQNESSADSGHARKIASTTAIKAATPPATISFRLGPRLTGTSGSAGKNSGSVLGGNGST